MFVTVATVAQPSLLLLMQFGGKILADDNVLDHIRVRLLRSGLGASVSCALTKLLDEEWLDELSEE